MTENNTITTPPTTNGNQKPNNLDNTTDTSIQSVVKTVDSQSQQFTPVTAQTVETLEKHDRYQHEKLSASQNANYVRAMFFFGRFFNAFTHIGVAATEHLEGEFNLSNFVENLTTLKRHPTLSHIYMTVIENYITSIFSVNNTSGKDLIKHKANLFASLQEDLFLQMSRNNILINQSETSSKLMQFKDEFAKQKKVYTQNDFCIAEQDSNISNHRLWLLKEFLLLSLKVMDESEWLVIGNHLRNTLALSVIKTEQQYKPQDLFEKPLFRLYSNNDEQKLNGKFDNLIDAIMQFHFEKQQEYAKEAKKLEKEMIEQGSDFKQAAYTAGKYSTEKESSSEHRDKLKMKLYEILVTQNENIIEVDKSMPSQSINDILIEISSKHNERGEIWRTIIKTGFFGQHEVQPSLIYN